MAEPVSGCASTCNTKTWVFFHRKVFHIFVVLILSSTCATLVTGAYLVLFDSITAEIIIYEEEVPPFYENVEKAAFWYFWDEANPNNGLIRDKSTDNDMSSVAATGFGLSAVVVGENRGWITTEEAMDRVLRTLEFFRDNVEGKDGFFYHFVWMENGKRHGSSEVSPIDTAILVAGALHAAEHFRDNDQIVALAENLYESVKWDSFLRPDGAFYSSWTPEGGYEGKRMGYDEYILLYLMALGSPTYPIPASSWDVWASTYEWVRYGDIDAFLCPGGYMRPTAYLYQFPAIFIDFRDKYDKYADYWDMIGNALRASRRYALDWAENEEYYDNNLWGWSASEGPEGYLGWEPFQGVIVPSAVAGSMPWMPELSNSQLNYQYNNYGENIWGTYGFKDAFSSGYNSGEGWYFDGFVGINKAKEVMLVEAYRSGLIWDEVMRNWYIHEGLRKAGFTYKIYPSDDTFADNTAPGTTRGDLQYLSAENTAENQRFIFIKFDLSSQLPSGFRIGEAKLNLYLSDGGPGEVSVYELENDDWDENTLTWNNMPSYGPVIDGATLPDAGNWVAIDVTSWADVQFDGDNVVSIVVRVDENLARFGSKEYADNTKQRPYLGIRLAPIMPVLISPTNEAEEVGKAPTFVWTPGAGADNHRLLVDNDPDFSSPNENRLLGPTDNTYTIADENALPLDNYYWKVIAIKDGVETHSYTWSFTVTPTVSENFYPTDDTFSESTNPDTNYGDDWRIGVSGISGYLRRGYLKFDLSSVPSGYQIIDTKLHLYNLYPNVEGYEVVVYELDNDNWDEDTLTWNNQPDHGAEIHRVVMPENGNWVTWDVTSWVDNQYKGDGIVSVVLRIDASQETYFTSKDDSEWPYLEITYAWVGKPTLYSPSDGTMTSDDTPTFEWTIGGSADNHRLLVDNDPDFSSPKINLLLGPTDNTYTPAEGLAPDNYHWKVVAIRDDVEIESDVWTFVITSAPILSSPEDGTATLDPSPTFTWTPGVNAESHRLQIATDSGFTSVVYDNSNLGPTDGSCTIENALPYDNYYWRVAAIVGETETWSDGWTFEVVESITYIIQPTNDTKVESNSPSTNYGTETHIAVAGPNSSYYRRSFFKFDLSSIPSGNVIANARLCLYKYDDGASADTNRDIGAYRVDNDDWNENVITWNDQPAIGNLENYIAISTSTGLWESWDITNWVDNQYQGDSTVSIALKMVSERSDWNSAEPYYYSKEWGTANQRPYLEIVVKFVGTPTLVSPENGSVTTDNTPTFVWVPGKAADNHRLLVDNNLDFSSPEINVILGSKDNTYTIPSENELSPDNYYWKVVAIRKSVEEESDVWMFKLSALGKPSLISPENDAQTLDNTPTFTWTPGKGAESHRLQIATDSGFTDVVYDNSNLGPADNSCTIENVLPCDNYYWRVAAIAGGTEEWSATWTFEVVENVTVTYYPSDDTYINVRSGDSNYGSSTPMEVHGTSGWYEYIFIKFQLTNIPSGAGSVASATLYMRAEYKSSTCGDILVHEQDNDDWSESILTWNNAPSPKYGDEISRIGPPPSSTWVSWDVRAWVDEQFNGDKVVSMVLTSTNEWCKFDAKESDYDPYLVVTYD